MKVLIVDDNPLNRLLPVVWLTCNGYAVEECPDGRTALERLSEGGFDAVLLDQSMPGMSGMEVCSRLRASPEGAALRIVAYTAHASPDLVDRLRAVGFDDVLFKPITSKQLLRALALH